jgi:hypothetical protein
MKDVLFALPGIALTILCWGSYGPVLHKGQEGLEGDRLKPLICVGLAYLIVAVIVPSVWLASTGKMSGWHFSGVTWSMMAGAAGAGGALGIILALTAGGKPIYVMPLVFGAAPIVNVFVSMFFARIPLRDVNPIFVAGLILVSVGAAVVLIFQPRGHAREKPAPAKQARVAAAEPRQPRGGSAAGSPAASDAQKTDPRASDAPTAGSGSPDAPASDPSPEPPTPESPGDPQRPR